MTPVNQNTNRVYPGMGCPSTEFFVVDKETTELKVIHNCKILPFSEISFATMEIIDEAIDHDKRAEKELFKMHPDSKMKRREQFAKCRFGGLDYKADIKDGVLQDGEYWDCPKRGDCTSEGILCKLPSYNGKRLEQQEVKLLQLTATNKTNEAIAEELNLPLGSFHKAKKILWQNLGIQTKQEGVMISVLLNLIQL